MLATHDLSADKAGALDPEDLFTISAGGFSATADAFARDPDSQGLWFLSMVGSQTALKAIWASLLKQPPEVAHLIKGADGMALSGGYQRCSIPYNTIGTWTTKIARLPVGGGWHALVFTKTAEYAFERDDSCCWRRARARPQRFTTASSTREVPCPCTAPGPAGCGSGAWRTAR